MDIDGTGITQKKAVGNIVKYKGRDFEYKDKTSRTSEKEDGRFKQALEKAEKQLGEAAERTGADASEDEADIFKAQIQFLKDPQINSSVENKLEEDYTAEKAVELGFKQPIEQLESQEGRTAERADDLRDIRDRLIGILTEKEKTNLSNLPEESIIAAKNLRPSDTSKIDKSKVKGIITARGSRTSHVAILSKSMGIPAVVGTGNIEELEDGERVLVDSRNGKIVTEPTGEQVEKASENNEIQVIEESVKTKDGMLIDVAANVANHEEVEKAVKNGADGIGLYRTEFMFLDREDPPTEEEHYENYVDALNQFPGERVIIRTMDIGGDKPVPYLDLEEKDNPFLGRRGIRLAFKEAEDFFDVQVKALLRAAATENGDNLAVMFPMISSVGEFEEVIRKIEYLEGVLEGEERSFERPEIGLMIETPSTVQMAGELAERADFLSIGTNDLTQYTMAASRTDSRVSDLQDPLQPSVIRSIKRTVEEGHENDAWVGMCGEMAGNPITTELLIGLGLDELSMSSGVLPRIKNKVRNVSSEEAEDLANDVLESSTRNEVESFLDCL